MARIWFQVRAERRGEDDKGAKINVRITKDGPDGELFRERRVYLEHAREKIVGKEDDGTWKTDDKGQIVVELKEAEDGDLFAIRDLAFKRVEKEITLDEVHKKKYRIQLTAPKKAVWLGDSLFHVSAVARVTEEFLLKGKKKIRTPKEKLFMTFSVTGKPENVEVEEGLAVFDTVLEVEGGYYVTARVNGHPETFVRSEHQTIAVKGEEKSKEQTDAELAGFKATKAKHEANEAEDLKRKTKEDVLPQKVPDRLDVTLLGNRGKYKIVVSVSDSDGLVAPGVTILFLDIVTINPKKKVLPEGTVVIPLDFKERERYISIDAPGAKKRLHWEKCLPGPIIELTEVAN